MRHIGTGTFKATDRMRELLNEVLDSGRISYGEKSMRFERWFAKHHDCKYGVLSNSGTSSLHVALQAMKELHGWMDGDEVIVPASTFVATVNVVLHNNLRPVFVDVRLDDYGIDPLLIERAITDRTRAIIPVHLYGQSCAMSLIQEVVRPYDLRIIEDSCETMFADHYSDRVGSMGDIGCFSLYNAHILTAGVGGVATTNDPGYAAKMRSLVNHGLDIQELNTDENFSPRPAVGRSFRFTHAGHSYRITEMEAAIALAQLEAWPAIIKGRRRNARHLTAGLERINRWANMPFILPGVASGNTHSWMMYPILCRPERVHKRKLINFLNERGIETRDMMPIVSQPIYADILDPQYYPVASLIDRNGFYIGCHQDLTTQDIEYVLDAFREFVDVKEGLAA